MKEITFAESDAAAVESAVLTAYEKIAGVTLYPGDPIRLFLESLAYTIVLQSGVINLAGRQNLLAYAQGDHLDYIGQMVGTPRLGAHKARSRQQFTLSEPLGFDVTIPAGVRVTTADGAKIFATITAATIPAGALSATADTEALASGAAGNGLMPGQIDQLIDPLPYVTSTANLDMSLLGSDDETDDRYRARIQIAPEAYSCAGPAGAYRSAALAVHQGITDAAVWCPTPGTVDVRPVMAGGEIPPDEVLEDMRKALSAENVRPLTDTVTVAAPEIVNYRIELTWYMARENEPLLATTQARVEAAVEEYRRWQREKPGRDVLPLRLLSALEKAGARRVDMAEPQYKAVAPYQIARDSEVVVHFGGVEND